MSEPRPHTLLIVCGIAIATLISTITGLAIGQAINNNVSSQAGRSSPNTIQPVQQASPTPTTQEPTQVQPVSPDPALPVDIPVQGQPIPTQTEKCANPDDLDSRGRRCGKRSAYTQGPTTNYDSNR